MFESIREEINNLETPLYLYDREVIEEKTDMLLEKFSHCAEIFFAVKANSSIPILKILKEKNIGAEVVSPGELYICVKGGFNPNKILYNNIARKEECVLYAIREGISSFNFEAIDQAILLEKCAKKLKIEIKIFLRINPGIFSKTHPHLRTGSTWSKFGINMDNLPSVYDLTKDFKFAKLNGIHCHIGSQILSSAPFLKAEEKVCETLDFFENKGLKIKYVNLGGGFGIPYQSNEKALDFTPLVKSYERIIKNYDVKIFLEPGRFLVGSAGYIVTRVISIKKRNGMFLYVIDTGMNENHRPALYGAYHHIEPLFEKNEKRRKARVVGPICENADEFGFYELPELKIGDLLLIHNCGAYIRTMASNYNGRLLPAEFVWDKNGLKIIRDRQIYENLIENERY
jgi:diaminopimelate decarboxylase